MALLSVNDLCAYYRTEVYGVSRTVRAVDGVSFELYPNEIYGVAGESSCGKTTLIKILATLLTKDAGKVEILGYDLDRDAETIRDQAYRQGWEVLPRGGVAPAGAGAVEGAGGGGG